jgi:uncharacterized cupredoxin-like copper-binding protein
MRNLCITALLSVGLAFPAVAADLSRQKPIEVKVSIGNALGKNGFFPNKLTFETGKLYRLRIKNPSNKPHYFTSLKFASAVWTRKVQHAAMEVKGAITEVEVFPGHTADWYFVPVATGTFKLICKKKGHEKAGGHGQIVVK